jgi:hypothetical protein
VRPIDYYVMYTIHNYQFLAHAAAMEGRKSEALEAIAKVRSLLPDQLLKDSQGADWYVGEEFTMEVRFALWDRILTEPPPTPSARGLWASYTYARIAALAAMHRLEEADLLLTDLQNQIAAIPTDYPAGLNSARNVLAIAFLDANARIAAARGEDSTAVDLLQKATKLEDELEYDEPEDWLLSERLLLGNELLHHGDNVAAEAVFAADLKKHPNNGWTLYGLAQSMDAQGREEDAASARKQFVQAWQHADITVPTPGI